MIGRDELTYNGTGICFNGVALMPTCSFQNLHFRYVAGVLLPYLLLHILHIYTYKWQSVFSMTAIKQMLLNVVFSILLVLCANKNVTVCRLAWQSLGSMSQEDAMSEFISFLRKSCALFAPYVEAHVAERQERERKR